MKILSIYNNMHYKFHIYNFKLQSSLTLHIIIILMLCSITEYTHGITQYTDKQQNIIFCVSNKFKSNSYNIEDRKQRNIQCVAFILCFFPIYIPIPMYILKNTFLLLKEGSIFYIPNDIICILYKVPNKNRSLLFTMIKF